MFSMPRLEKFESANAEEQRKQHEVALGASVGCAATSAAADGGRGCLKAPCGPRDVGNMK